jgi:hypothetical protein
MEKPPTVTSQGATALNQFEIDATHFGRVSSGDPFAEGGKRPTSATMATPTAT